MRKAEAISEPRVTPSRRFARCLAYGCSLMLSLMLSCDRVPQVRLHFRDADLAELDTVQFELRDSEGTVIGAPDGNPVKVADLLLDGNVSLYLDQAVRLPKDVSIHYIGLGSGNCKVTEGMTEKVQISESGQLIDVPLSFPPKLTLRQRSEAPPRPGRLGFTVGLEPDVAIGAPSTDLCPSKSQPDSYYVPNGHKVHIDVSDKDSFTVFDGWDDQDCPSDGSCSTRRTETVAKDAELTAKFASWNCLQPDSFCSLAPVPGRYQKAVEGLSAMSGWVAPNRELWVVGHRGPSRGPNAGLTTMIRRWTGSNWAQEDAELGGPTRRCWDITGNPSASNIFVSCEDGVFQYANGKWQKELVLMSASAIWVGDNEVWVAGSDSGTGKPAITQRALSDGARWSSVDGPVITGLSTSLHSIAGDDEGTIIATGKDGTILLISRVSGQLRVDDRSDTMNSESIFSAFWHKGSATFLLSAKNALYVLNPLVMSWRKYEIPVVGSIFGTWVPPQLNPTYPEVWTTGSYGKTRRCQLHPLQPPACTDLQVIFDKTKRKSTTPSLRVLIGPDESYLWAVGYEQEDPAQINLLRYCPSDRCKPQ